MSSTESKPSLIQKTDKIFVAGRGLAGGAIVRALQKAGYNSILNPARAELDLTDAIAVNDYFVANKPDVVVLAAAKVGGIHANNTHPADFILINLKIQNNVIESAWRNGTRRLLFLGSSCIYPKAAAQPMVEECLLTGPLEPTNDAYAIAKISGIMLCRSLRKQYGFDAISLMPTNLYGPGDNFHPEHSHVLPALMRRFHEAKEAKASSVTCWGTGSPYREFLHVDDLADACVWALENYQGEIHLNVGTGVDLTLKELAETMKKVVGFEGTIEWDHSKPDGTPKKQLDMTRTKALGWQAQIPLSEGLASTYQWFLENVANLRSV